MARQPQVQSTRAEPDHARADHIQSAEVAELIRIARHHHLSELTVQQGTARVEIHLAAPAATFAADVTLMPESTEVEGEPAADTVEVVSPMTGIFYAAPSPGEPPFVHPGDIVRDGDPIGLIEAMKVFSEVLADRSGRVRRVLAVNGQLVQQGAALLELTSIEPPEAS